MDTHDVHGVYEGELRCMGKPPRDLQSKKRLQALEQWERGLSLRAPKSTTCKKGALKEAATIWLSLSLIFSKDGPSLSNF